MKHAILLIAFHNVNYVKWLIRTFDKDFLIFIHWDKKCFLSEQDEISLTNISNVKFFSNRFEVNWASYGIVRATLLLCEEAVKYNDIEYLHLISDADIMTKDIKYLKNFFYENKGKNFIDYNRYYENKTTDYIYQQIRFYHHLEKYDIRNNKDDLHKYKEEINEQEVNKDNRTLPNIPIYGGSAWWSLTKECVKYLLSMNDFIEKYFIDTKFPDEIFAQTVIMNSKFADTVVNNDLRYIVWEFRNNNRPAILDKSDLSAIINSNDFFARKIDPIISIQLIDSINKIYINNNSFCLPINIHSLDLIIRYLNLKCYNCLITDGLLFGKLGVLILFVIYNNYIENQMVLNDNDIAKILEYVTKEFLESKDNSYETGKVGLAVGLEYSMIYCKDKINPLVLEELNNVNSEIVNYIVNFADNKMTDKKLSIFNNYFRAREHGDRLSNIDRSTWNYMRHNTEKSYHDNSSSKTTQRWNQTVGITGYAGRGLEILYEKCNLDKHEWMYLLNY